jgi:hypothetical protein
MIGKFPLLPKLRSGRLGCPNTRAAQTAIFAPGTKKKLPLGAALLAQGQVSDANTVRNRPKLPNCIKITRWGCQLAKYCHQLADKTSPKDEMAPAAAKAFSTVGVTIL